MQFPRLAATLALVLGIVACGKEGPSWHGEVEHEGVTVEYETFYSPPSLGEKIGHASGYAGRLVINGKTMALSPGVKHPDDWDEQGNASEYGQEFWGQVAEKLRHLPNKDHEDEHVMIVKMAEALRDSPGFLAADHTDKQALRIQQEDPELAAEAAYSKATGEKMIAAYREEHPEEFQADTWSSGGSDVRRAKNRGFRHQIREDGYEYHQVLELWADHALFGWDHSGTRARTYRRPKGSNAAWQPIGNYIDACNHGDCPAEKHMRLRQVCDSGVVSDWYVIDGECEGNWMTSHLCNDDTSIQINHAQGIWTGWKCPGAKRGIVPKCGPQFK